MHVDISDNQALFILNRPAFLRILPASLCNYAAELYLIIQIRLITSVSAFRLIPLDVDAEADAEVDAEVEAEAEADPLPDLGVFKGGILSLLDLTASTLPQNLLDLFFFVLTRRARLSLHFIRCLCLAEYTLA